MNTESVEISASELRIGNYQESGSFKVRPLGISELFTLNGKTFSKINGIGIHYAEMMAQKFTPIQISEEWLNKLGFVKNAENYDFTISNGNLSDGLLKIILMNNHDLSGFKVMIEGDNEEIPRSEMVEIKEIKYIHQLQNIYYAIFGEELELSI